MRPFVTLTYFPSNVTSSPAQSRFITRMDSSSFGARFLPPEADGLELFLTIADGDTQQQRPCVM